MNIKKTGRLMIALVAGAAFIKTIMDDKLKKQESEKEAIKGN